MYKISVIIPVNDYNNTVKGMLRTAINSCKPCDGIELDVAVVCSENVHKSLLKDFSAEKYKAVRYMVNTGETDFCSQINFAVGDVADYFTILEYDDVFTDIWFKNVKKHLETQTEDISVYLPLTQVLDWKTKDEGAIGYINEAVLASSFSERIGFLDKECLQDYMNFNLTGGLFKTEDFINVGKLKPSIKLTFWYEYMLRAVNKGQKIYVIPKVGYLHIIARPNSLSEMYKNTISEDEANWWFELAQKEYLFLQDRKKEYEG